jgi:uncharacterized damage-inducible protein DinB
MGQEEIKRIIDQIERLHNDNWAGLNLYQTLGEITDSTANLKLPFFNSTIHQISRHILATEFVVIKRLQGIDHSLTDEKDWIPIDKINFKWLDTVNTIKESKNKLISELRKVADADLNKPIIKDFSSVYVTLHGHIQHSFYHIGQIVLMKKIIERTAKMTEELKQYLARSVHDK